MLISVKTGISIFCFNPPNRKEMIQMQDEIVIELGTDRQGNTVGHNFSNPLQTDLSISGMKGAGKSNLLNLIANQVLNLKVKTYILDPTGESYIPGTTLICDYAEINSFLKSVCDIVEDRFIFIDEVATILRGRDKRQQENRESVAKILSLGRHRGVKMILATQIPNRRSFGSDDTIFLNISSWCYLRLQENDICPYDTSRLQVGQAIYTSPRVRENYSPAEAVQIQISLFEREPNPLEVKLMGEYGQDFTRKILSFISTQKPSQYNLRNTFKIGSEKASALMSILESEEYASYIPEYQNTGRKTIA
jgi:hypothetical protein